jgi:hypothetical protein
VNTIQVLGSGCKTNVCKKTKETLEEGKASDIYLDFGYNNLSNFSTAFKTNSKGPKEIN